MIDRPDLIISAITIVLIFIGVLKIHRSLKSRDSFLMFLAVILALSIGLMYIGAWAMVRFYYGPDNSPLILSYFLSRSELTVDLIFLMGAIGFWGFAKRISQKPAR